LPLSFFRRLVDRVPIALPDSHDENDQLLFAYLIDKAVADAAQLDLVAVRVARELGGWNPRFDQALGQFFLELLANRAVEPLPFG
jgi:hypothetical protein